MTVIEILPEAWRVYFDGDDKLVELENGEQAPEGTSVFHLAPVPFDLSLVGLSGRSLDETSGVLMDRAHEIIVGWEGVMGPASGEPAPWSEEAVKRLPRTIMATLITHAQSKTWQGASTEGNVPSDAGPGTKCSDGNDSTGLEAAMNGENN